MDLPGNTRASRGADDSPAAVPRVGRLHRFESGTYALLRTLTGLLFACHGAQKLFGLAGGIRPAVGTQLWFGGVIELACGLAIATGTLTSIAAFLASGTMAVAYVQFHWKVRFDENFLPAANGGELALVYALLFLFVSCRGVDGPGLGRWLARRIRQAATHTGGPRG